jgi:FlaG/FlaF family flagellin (archaellin)
MARQFSIRLLGGAGERPLVALVRLVAVTLVLVAVMAVVSLPTGSRSSSWTAFLSTVAAATRWQPSDAQVGSQLVDRDAAKRANNDGYVEGLVKVLDQDLR